MRCKHEIGPWPGGQQWPGCLKCEIEQLRGNLSLAEEGLANYQQELQRIRQESLTWSLVCQCDCAACEKLFSMIKHAVPQTAEHGALRYKP